MGSVAGATATPLRLSPHGEGGLKFAGSSVPDHIIRVSPHTGRVD